MDFGSPNTFLTFTEMHMKMNVIAAHMAALLTAATSVALQAQPLPAGPKVVIEAVTQVAPTIPQYTMVDQPVLRDGLAKRSNGRIEVKLQSWPERNVNGPEVLRLVRAGQVDVAAVALTVVSGDVPLLDMVDLVGMNLDINQAHRVADAMVPVANKELERLGIKLVATYPFSGQMLFCRQPLNKLSDIKNMKVRTSGPSASDLIKALGAQPVSIAFGEVYSALERGTVDCGMTGSGSGNGVKWPEVTSHLYSQPLSWSVAGYFVNLAWWNKLDPAVRSVVEQTFAEVQDAQWKLGLQATEDGVACNVGRQADCKIHSLVKTRPMVEVKADASTKPAIQKAFVEDVLPSWVKRCGDRCGQIYNDVVAPITGVKYVK